MRYFPHNQLGFHIFMNKPYFYAYIRLKVCYMKTELCFVSFQESKMSLSQQVLCVLLDFTENETFSRHAGGLISFL